MTTHDDSSTTCILRDLDVADRELSQPQRSRAAVTLDRILATDPGSRTTTVAADRRPSRLRLLVLVGGVVTAVSAAVVAVPSITRSTEAFASWSPTPVELEGAERAAALRACLLLQSGHEGELALDPDALGQVLLAEARGGWNYVVFTAVGSSGRKLQGSCLAPDDLVAEPLRGDGGFFGSLGGAEETAGPQPAPDVMREDAHGVGSVDDETFVFAEGRAGAEVVSIEVTAPGGMEVDASLENGRWAVWWPAGDDPMRSPDVRQAPAYEVTLSDGTMARTFR